jgi:hypothetical protein
MILNDLFESRMSDLNMQYQDYKDMSSGGFYSRYKMTKDQWAGKHWSLIKSSETVHEGAMKDLHTELAEKYRELAPKVEKYKDSFLAGQLYDALEAIAIEHGAELELKRMMTGARNRAHMDYDTNPGGFQNWFWYLPFADEDVAEEQVNELDKATLASYVKKAAPDRYNRIPNDLMQMKDAEKNRRQWVTRDKGIDQALAKLSKEDVTEDNQDDRNARIIAGEIEDAMSQGNKSLAQQKIKELKKLGYYFDKQGRLQKMGMYEADVAEGWPKPVGFTPDIVTALKAQGYKGPYKLSQLKKWYKELNGFEGINADDDIMVQGNDIEYDGWVIPVGSKFLMGAEHMVGPASAKEILKLDEKQDACYHKVKSRYKVWPSAYASGALVQCRKKGAANWGNKSKK